VFGAFITGPNRSIRSNRSTASLTNYCGPFQTFQTFNRYAPFNAFGGSKGQEPALSMSKGSNVQGRIRTGNFDVSGIVEMSKRSMQARDDSPSDHLGGEGDKTAHDRRPCLSGATLSFDSGIDRTLELVQKRIAWRHYNEPECST